MVVARLRDLRDQRGKRRARRKKEADGGAGGRPRPPAGTFGSPRVPQAAFAACNPLTPPQQGSSQQLQEWAGDCDDSGEGGCSARPTTAAGWQRAAPRRPDATSQSTVYSSGAELMGWGSSSSAEMRAPEAEAEVE
eukprot:gene18513-19110_t